MTSQAVEETWIRTGGYGRLRAVTGGYGRLRAVTAGSGAKWVKLDLVKITLEGNPKLRDHADK